MGTDDEWIDVVADTLSELGMIDASTREALLDSLRESAEREGRPAVTVLPGGQDGPPPRGSEAGPSLRVVQGNGEDLDDGPLDLKILRLGRGGSHPSEVGLIDVEAGETQVIQWRPELAALRVTCDAGHLEVHADGDLLFLRAGQSLDISARVIKIQPLEGPQGDHAQGRYVSIR